MGNDQEPMTLAKIRAVKKLAEEAAPGPWAINDRNEYGDLYVGTPDRDWIAFAIALLPHEPMRPNAEFIAASRTAVPALCDLVEECIDLIRRLQTSYADPPDPHQPGEGCIDCDTRALLKRVKGE